MRLQRCLRLPTSEEYWLFENEIGTNISGKTVEIVHLSLHKQYNKKHLKYYAEVNETQQV